MKISWGNKYLVLEKKLKNAFGLSFIVFFGKSIMAIQVVKFLREGYKIRKVFGLELPVVKWNYQILIIGGMLSCQKLDITLQN